jgi:hypothetical protein
MKMPLVERTWFLVGGLGRQVGGGKVEGFGWVESLGVLRRAQDDSKDKRDDSKDEDKETQQRRAEMERMARESERGWGTLNG